MGLFDAFQSILGPDTKQNSNDPNSPNYAGGSRNIFATDPNYTNKVYGVYNSLNSYASNPNNIQTVIQPDRNGFMPYQYAGLQQMASQLGNKFSGAYAARGALSPESTGAIVGSALQNSLPNLFSLQNQNQLIPGMVNQGNIMTLSSPLAPLQSLGNIGGTSLGSGTNYNNINSSSSNYWSMLNNIGSFWGGGGGGKAAGIV